MSDDKGSPAPPPEGKAPFPPMKNGRALLPEIGSDVYVPSHKIGDTLVIGGRAKIKSITGTTAGPRPTTHKAVIEVEESPGVPFKWNDLREDQYSLWNRMGLSRSRPATPEEVEALAAKVAAREKALADFEASKEAKGPVAVEKTTPYHQPGKRRFGGGREQHKQQPSGSTYPSYILKAITPGGKHWNQVGAAWSRPDGSLFLRLDPCVTLSWKDDVTLALYPYVPKTPT